MTKRTDMLVVVGTLLYLLSDIIAKKYLSSTSIYLIVSFRYFCGIVLIPWLTWSAFTSWRSHFFSTVNIVNSAAGVLALIYGTIQGFAIASQFRPIFMSLVLFVIGVKITASQSIRMLLAFILSLAIALDGSVFNVWTAVFLATIFLQCVSFALVNKTKEIPPIAFAALYNLIGSIICLFTLFFVQWDHPDLRTLIILIISSSISVIGSVALILAFAKTSSSSSAMGLYIRLPLSIFAGLFIFGETPTPIASILVCLLVCILIFDAWKNTHSPKP